MPVTSNPLLKVASTMAFDGAAATIDVGGAASARLEFEETALESILDAAVAVTAIFQSTPTTSFPASPKPAELTIAFGAFGGADSVGVAIAPNAAKNPSTDAIKLRERLAHAPRPI